MHGFRGKRSGHERTVWYLLAIGMALELSAEGQGLIWVLGSIQVA